MATPPVPARLDSTEAIDAEILRLVALDPRLGAVANGLGPIAPRTTEAGFHGLAKIVCGQQLSVASARAIWARYEALEGALDPVQFLALEEATIRATGFSSGKFKTLRAAAEAIAAGDLDLDHVASLPAEEAVAHLTRHKGVGPWTAEIYLLFCAGHPDIFPAGDLALQKAVAQALNLSGRPSVNALIEIAKAWSPHRGAAALLFWKYYASQKQKEGIAL